MRFIVAQCSVVYTGRGDTKMNSAVRAIIIKEDGAISIHHDIGNKPLNYMGKGNIFTVEYDDAGDEFWRFDTRKENLTIHMQNIISDTAYELEEEDEGLIRDGTEDHLQEWLADNPTSIGEGFTTVQREYQTGAGPVDILMQDSDETYIAVEVKRVAMLTAVDQVNRYVKALQETEGMENTRGMVAALDLRPNTIKLADKRGIEYVTIPSEWKETRKLKPKE